MTTELGDSCGDGGGDGDDSGGYGGVGSDGGVGVGGGHGGGGSESVPLTLYTRSSDSSASFPSSHLSIGVFAVDTSIAGT